MSRQVHVCNFSEDVSAGDVEEIFLHIGRIASTNISMTYLPEPGLPFGLVDFENPRDAEDAVAQVDGMLLNGQRLRVKFACDGTGERGSYSGGPEERGGGREGDGDDESGRDAPARRSQYRVVVTGLPASGSTQDLKNHMREAGDISFSVVYKDGTGVVEFLRYEDMKYAIKKLDDSRFRSHKGDTEYIRIKEYHAASASGDQTRSRSRSRSYSSPARRRHSRRESSLTRSRSPVVTSTT